MWLQFEGLNTGHEIHLKSEDIRSLEICNGHTDCKEDDQAIRIDMGESFYSIKYSAEALASLNEALGLCIIYTPPKIKVTSKSTVQ